GRRGRHGVIRFDDLYLAATPRPPENERAGNEYRGRGGVCDCRHAMTASESRLDLRGEPARNLRCALGPNQARHPYVRRRSGPAARTAREMRTNRFGRRGIKFAVALLE